MRELREAVTAGLAAHCFWMVEDPAVTTVNVARVIGPTIAAVLVSTIGIGWCFIVNAR